MFRKIREKLKIRLDKRDSVDNFILYGFFWFCYIKAADFSKRYIHED